MQKVGRSGAGMDWYEPGDGRKDWEGVRAWIQKMNIASPVSALMRKSPLRLQQRLRERVVSSHGRCWHY
jgi:hypothetical protein